MQLHKLELYRNLAKYDSWFKELAKYIEYKPFTCDLHIDNFGFAMRN